MKWISRSVLLLAVIAFTTQDITGRKGCDCSICKGVDNKLSPLVGKKTWEDGGGKSSCNICERKKEMLRLERERQRQLQKCPFEILGAPSMKGKTSEEIFDEFRELIVPSQNGFFDMMRGIVRTMHGTSVAELQRAKEKEALELAKKKKQEAEEAKKKRVEAEEARKRKALNLPNEEIVNLNNPISPKVTVVLKQTPCGQIIQPSEKFKPEKSILMKRLMRMDSSNVPRIHEEEDSDLQSLHLSNDHYTGGDYIDLNSNSDLHPDVIDELIGYKTMMITPPENEETITTEGLEEDFYKIGEQSDLLESTTESPYVKFISNDEMKALLGRKSSLEDFDMGVNMLSNDFDLGLQGVGEENAQSTDYSLLPVSS